MVYNQLIPNSNTYLVDGNLFFFTREKTKLKLFQYDFKTKRASNNSKEMVVTDDFDSIKFIDDRIKYFTYKTANDFRIGAIAVMKNKDNKFFVRKLSQFTQKIYDGESKNVDNWTLVEHPNSQVYLYNNHVELEKSMYIPVSQVNQVLKCGTAGRGKTLISKTLQAITYSHTQEHFFFDFNNNRELLKMYPIIEIEKIIDFIKQSMELDIRDVPHQRVSLAFDQ